MTPPLTSRLRESAKAMKSLDSVSLRPSTLALIDRESAVRIAAELAEAADALEAGRVLAEFAKTAPGRLPQRVQDAVALVAQVAQEGGNTPYDEGPFTIEGGGVATAGALPDPKLCPRCCQYHGPVCPAGVPAKWSPCDECTTRPACARMAACIEEPRHG